MAVIELAITLPLLLAFLFGIVSYGEWFYISHGVQQAANDAARSSVSGLSKDERYATIVTTVNASIARGTSLDPTRVNIVVADDGSTVVVRLAYNAANDPLLSLGFIPGPGTTIQRSAAVLLGGM